jgi:L,D-peptidoglycan transpeptidase YkuD (ErfK/YbiS/YcfS/YnhG family)
MTIIIKNKETLIFDDFIFRCSVGKNGTTKNKIESDKKTPLGTFNIGNLYFRSDKNKKPNTKLKCVSIKKNMGWCDDVNYKKDYNKLITIKKKIKHEKLYRKDSKYDFLIPISYNRKKTIPGKGSAIFLHLTNNYKGTLGCVTLKKNDFLILLKLIDKNTKIKII